jgi:Domain of unknown function (DUF4340)
MKTDLAEQRQARAFRLMLVAGALAAVAAITLMIESRSLRPDSAAGLVAPGLSESIAEATQIKITSAEATYSIARVQRGDEQIWVMRERDDYPVAGARITQLKTALQNLHYQRRMTSDPSKHERLGVTDPQQGGRGVLVEVEGAGSALLFNMIFGIETGGGGLYVRRPDQEQAWAARAGEEGLPPLRDIAAWLDLRPLDLAPERIARLDIAPATGRAYVLARDVAEGPWRIANPALAPGALGSLSTAALAITQVAPDDVRTAPAIQGPVRARVRAMTFDGIAIEGEIIESQDKLWLKLVARAATPDQEPIALALNNRVAAWAYGLSDFGAESLAPPLGQLTAAPP